LCLCLGLLLSHLGFHLGLLGRHLGLMLLLLNLGRFRRSPLAHPRSRH
jgi:hypothetical protein